MYHHAAVAAAAAAAADAEMEEKEREREMETEMLEEAYNTAQRAAERAGEALMAAHLAYADVANEERDMLEAAAAATAAMAGRSKGDGAGEMQRPGDVQPPHLLVYYDYCEALEEVLERRAALEGDLHAAVAELRRAQAEEEAAAADAEDAAWGGMQHPDPDDD
jgi:hypothetical protein